MSGNGETQYKLEVQPGLVEKVIYKIEQTEITSAIPPAVNGKFEAPYVANIEVPMGTERITVKTKDEQMKVNYGLRGQNPLTRFGNLVTLLWKVGASEMGAIFSNTKKSVVNYTGLPTEAQEEVQLAEQQFGRALQAYLRARTPTQKVMGQKKEVISILPTGPQRVSLETIEDTL